MKRFLVKSISTFAVLLVMASFGAAAFATENDDVVDTVEVVQGNTVVTDIILLDSGYVCVTKETETFEGADDVTPIDLSSEIEWWKQFNSLTPDQQSRINFRPNRGTPDFTEPFPAETTPQ